MREVIPFMLLIKEVYFTFDIHFPKSEVFFKLIKENQSCIAVEESKRLSPRTKHIAIKYHHIRSFVKKYYSDMLY